MWRKLLESSDDICLQEQAFGLPAIARTVDQLHDRSLAINVNACRVLSSFPKEVSDHILANSKSTFSHIVPKIYLQLKPNKPFPPTSTSVLDYVTSTHDSTVSAVILHTHQQVSKLKEQYILYSTDLQWIKDRCITKARELQNSDLSERGLDVAVNAKYDHGTPSSQIFDDNLTEAGHCFATNQFSEAVQNLHLCKKRGQQIDVCQLFQEASRNTFFSSIWKILCKLTKSDNRQESDLLSKSLEHLESEFAFYIAEVIRRNAVLAGLGGDASDLSRVCAYIRVQNNKSLVPGVISADTVNSNDAPWQRLYLCVRCGFRQAALQQLDVMEPHLKSEIFLPLSQWLGGEKPTATAAVQLAELGLQVLSEGGRQLHDSLYQVLLLSVVTGSCALSESLLYKFPSLFYTIDDYVWCKIQLVTNRNEDATLQSLTLEELQNQIVEFPPSHFSKKGSEPFTYVFVLFLTLQFKHAYTQLLDMQRCYSADLDVLHIGVALVHHKLLSASDCSKVAGKSPVEEVVHYATSQATLRPDIAILYYAVAASLLADVPGNSGQEIAFKFYGELLATPGSNLNVLLGEISQKANLSNYVQSLAQQNKIICDAARLCEHRANHQRAIELYCRAGHTAAALAIINWQLVDAIAISFRLQNKSGIDGLVRQGDMIASKGNENAHEIHDFQLLKQISQILTASLADRHHDVVELTDNMRLFPRCPLDIEGCSEKLESLHPTITSLLPEVLVAALKSVSFLNKRASVGPTVHSTMIMRTQDANSAMKLRDRFGALSSFVCRARFQIPAHLYVHLAQLSSSS
mmetsp:Transcript_6290/g.22103  ORF Transcript_6290/g.22103 Transcript_6290/m.22103 type:complete len:803 (-) Transcript_6290:816-3224(-)|eukprot:CAMPEP_0183796694 /NCGR_PEP_ID=MMETSP0803_2-20130417/12300_1 /TAXON_ID=195967 /ORGANISM="Crustomastix stigmata, Strain CCMP3273" /LENGTH=802 /DNA_ID=CAMNT_0026041349 /DNA_START=150 /DNA_END=2558 /DNA_ORIENTATION=-